MSVHHEVVADGDPSIRSLHPSEFGVTANEHGRRAVSATTLDRLFATTRPDVLKIDTDGFDGAILAGARELLARAAPAVLFTWVPRSRRADHLDPQLAFDVLRPLDYDRWVFFTKYGHFSDGGLDALTRLGLKSTQPDDLQFDVAALHRSSPIDEVALADLRYWRTSAR